MKLNEYQDLASRTAKFPADRCPTCGIHAGLVYTALGIGGESGEILELYKKLIRDDKGELTEERRQKIKKELGDELWYLSQNAKLTGFTLEEVAESNIAKLASRADRGQIHGDGDNR